MIHKTSDLSLSVDHDKTMLAVPVDLTEVDLL